MIKQTIVCDRCGLSLDYPNLGNWATITMNTGNYPLTKSDICNLCPDCKTAFHRFMENKESAMTDMEQAHKILKKYV